MRHSITIEQSMIWKRNKLINPKTNRKIKVKGNLYNKLEKYYNKNFPNGYDVFDSVDMKDPISLTPFYIEDQSGNKKLIHENPEQLILYRESESIIRCFEKGTIEYLKAYNITKHPVSQKTIPDFIFDDVKTIELNKDITVSEKALQVFQIFTYISIFIDYELFLKLDVDALKKLNYELKDFYYQNFSDEDRSKIDKSDGKQFFKYSSPELGDKSDDEIKMYLLEQMENILSYKEDDLKIMINYVVLGGLSLVIDEVKEYYDNFNFSF